MNPTRFMDTTSAAVYHPDAMKTLLILVSFVVLTHSARACIWVDGTTLDGSHGRLSFLTPERDLKMALKHTTEERAIVLLSERDRINQNRSTQAEFDAVHQILLGNQDAAIAALEQLEKENPGSYSTAANLGTAYELKGDPETALKWISEGIRRNPDSHHGTEWLHVEILKTKLKLRQEPGYLHQHRIIQLPDSYTGKSQVTIGDRLYSVDEIRETIIYQLKERMLFVKPKDAIVADLLFTLAEIESRTRLLEPTFWLLDMATQYGFAEPALITARIDQYRSTIFWKKVRRTTYVILALIPLVFLARLGLRRKWWFLSGKAYRRHLQEKQASPATP